MNATSRPNGKARAALRAIVLEQHGAVCHLCGEPIPLDIDHRLPSALALDHVVPVMDGGSHGPENLRPSHRHCNLRRGASALPAKSPEAPSAGLAAGDATPSAAEFFKRAATVPQRCGPLSPPVQTKTTPQDGATPPSSHQEDDRSLSHQEDDGWTPTEWAPSTWSPSEWLS